jgi:hypothetical protein
MTSSTATLTVTANISIRSTNDLAFGYGALEKPVTLNVRPVEVRLSLPPTLRYPTIFSLPESDRIIRNEMLAAASSAFEFWLNEDDAVYDNL